MKKWNPKSVADFGLDPCIWNTTDALKHVELAEYPVIHSDTQMLRDAWARLAIARFMRQSSSVTPVDMEAGVLNP